jgi:hypothetical protein
MNRLTNLPEDIQEKIKYEVFKKGTTLEWDEDFCPYSVEAIKKHLSEFKIEDIVYLRTLNESDKADIRKLYKKLNRIPTGSNIWENRVRLFEICVGYKLRKNHPIKMFWIRNDEYPKYEIINFKAYIKI